MTLARCAKNVAPALATPNAAEELSGTPPADYGEHLACVRIYPNFKSKRPIGRSARGGIQGAARPSRHTLLAVVDPPCIHVGGARRCISASDPTGTGVAGRTLSALSLGRDRHDAVLWGASWYH